MDGDVSIAMLFVFLRRWCDWLRISNSNTVVGGELCVSTLIHSQPTPSPNEDQQSVAVETLRSTFMLLNRGINTGSELKAINCFLASNIKKRREKRWQCFPLKFCLPCVSDVFYLKIWGPQYLWPVRFPSFCFLHLFWVFDFDSTLLNLFLFTEAELNPSNQRLIQE